jgi:Xaa-Pro aminopeptidase
VGDREQKLERIGAILDAFDAPALAVTTPGTLAWLLDGARATVTFGGPPVFSAVVHRGGRVVVTAFSNEVDRLVAEQLGDTVEVESAPWYEPLPIADALAESAVGAELRAARAALLPEERARYRQLGRDVAAAVTAVLGRTHSEQSELDVSAQLAAALLAIDAEPVVLLVAGAQRLGYRHPVPTAVRLGSRAMVVVGARRHGLVVNLTRWVTFDGPLVSSRDDALLEVEAAAFAATRPGRELRQVLADIAEAYPRNGFGPDAWLGHHQGGPTGYFGRDPRVTPASAELVVAGQAFAWNPSVAASKVEDTVIVDDGGIEILTADPAWPTVEVHGRPRPRPLEPGREQGAPS